MAVSAKVVADSKFGSTRLITLEIELHRFVLPELNTHRALSRNFQSSRAVPVEKMIEQVRNNPAIPLHWGKNEPGMVANEELDNTIIRDSNCTDMECAKYYWNCAADDAAGHAEGLVLHGVHKQIVNRLLEPFMWTRGVTTATLDAWQAFLKLRNHKDAQPEIKVLAVEIEKAIEESEPVELKEGWWHTPYYDSGFWTPFHLDEDCTDNPAFLDEAIQISASCCAQVSYRKLDDSLEKAKKIYDMLNLPENGVYPEDPPHFSPTEHIARAGKCDSFLSGNFHNNDFIQYRKLLEIGIESEYIK